MTEVRLPEDEIDAARLAAFVEIVANIVEGRRAVDGGFALAEEIEIWTVEDVDDWHCVPEKRSTNPEARRAVSLSLIIITKEARRAFPRAGPSTGISGD
jgi:hypothetical protein